MNIIDTEDMIKGLPDAALQKEAQNPSGQAPQFLVVSEIKRRKDMRERYAQNQQSQGTVKDQLLGMAPPAPQPQMASMGQPQGRPMPPMGGQVPMGQPPMQQPAPPMGMYGGGVVRMAEGLTVPQTREEQLAFLAGKSPEEIIATAAQLGLNPNVLLGAGILNESQLEATIQQPPEEAAMTEYNALINPPQVGSYIEGLTESQSNPLDRFTQGVSTDKGFDPLNPPMFKAPTPQQPTDTRSNPFQAPEGTADAIRAKLAAMNTQGQVAPQNQAAPQGLEQVIAAKAANTGTNGVGMSGAGGQMKAAFEAPQVQAPPQRDPYTPMQGDLIKMLQPPATPEQTRDPYTPMQGDLIKMLQPQDQTAPALTGTSGVGMSGVGADMKRLVEAQERSALTGANGVGLSGVGADIKAGLERQAEADAPSVSPEVKDPTLGFFEGIGLGTDYGANYRHLVEQPKGSYDALVEKTTQQVLDSKTRKIGEIGARIAEINETQDTSNPRVQKTLAGLVKDQEKLTASIATGSGNAQSEDAAKLNRTSASTTVTQELKDIAAGGENKGNITQVPNADISSSNAATGVVAGLNLGKTTGSSILDNQTVQGGLDDITDRTEGEESSGYKIPQSLTDLQRRGRALGQTLISGREEESKLEAQMKDLIEKRTRPTLSYADLIRESEQSMATQLADIKNEKGTQALIALGAGIASGDLGKGLSDAGKAVATSNAQKRALEARQQAVRMGFRKSEVDAVYQNQIAKENDKLEGMKFSLESLRRANAATQENERIILNFDTDLQKTIATLEQSERFKRADRATQDALNRRAALDFVTDRMSKMQLLNKSQEEQTAISNDLLAQASTALGIEINTVSGAGSTGTSGTTLTFDDQGNLIE